MCRHGIECSHSGGLVSTASFDGRAFLLKGLDRRGAHESANLSGRARREPSHRGPGLLVKQPGKPGHPNAWSLVVLEQAKGRNHVVVHGRVPYADEPLYVGMG